MRPPEREDRAEHKREDAHHHEGVHKRPEHPQRHVAVADLEVLLHKIAEDVKMVVP